MPRAAPRLVAITLPDPSRLPGEAVLASLAPLVDLLILRLPGLEAGEYAAHARRLLALGPRPPVRLRAAAALAVELGADGVHLGEADPRLAQVALAHPGLLLSCSRHDPAGLRACTGAEFALLSPVAATASKPGVVPRPLGQLGKWARAAPVPVLALGGVEPALAPALRKEGFAGMAVMRGILGAPDPAGAARALRAAWEEGAP